MPLTSIPGQSPSSLAGNYRLTLFSSSGCPTPAGRHRSLPMPREAISVLPEALLPLERELLLQPGGRVLLRLRPGQLPAR